MDQKIENAYIFLDGLKKENEAELVEKLCARKDVEQCLNPGKPSRDLLQHVSRPDSPTKAREQ